MMVCAYLAKSLPTQILAFDCRSPALVIAQETSLRTDSLFEHLILDA